MIDLKDPFLVRIPEAIRFNSEPMEVDTIEFDGSVVRVTYHKASTSVGWWCARVTHEFVWLPEVRSPEDAVAHYFQWLSDKHPESALNDKHFAKLRRRVKPVTCGRGQAVYCSPDAAALRVLGGPNHIYLISESGTRGSLRIPDSAYHSYQFERCEVGPKQRNARSRRPGTKRR